MKRLLNKYSHEKGVGDEKKRDNCKIISGLLFFQWIATTLKQNGKLSITKPRKPQTSDPKSTGGI
jgi:hypothetical protein